MWLRLILCGALFLSTGLAGAERLNILWICAEDLSPFFGCYGHPEAITPNIDSFAAESTLFEQALTTAPICAPSRSSLATGMFAHSIGTQHLRSSVEIPKRIQPLAWILRENGYWTALRGKTDYNFSPDGLFSYWKNDTTPWRQCPEGTPFFAFLNLGSTHEGSGNLEEKAVEATGNLSPGQRHDPEETKLPPYFPDTPEMRRLWARYHDLATAFDLEVGKVLTALEEDGLAESTAVFLFSDHGQGMPRYKRWLYKTGLHVPLIVRFPGKKAHRVKRPVSMIDLPPTALELAGVGIPDHFQGKSLVLGPAEDPGGSWPIFAARDRADDMFDLSRLVYDGEFVYIRHFQPHQPPIQEGYIFSDRKDSLRELRRVHREGEDTPVSELLWEPRPVEELFHLPSDPEELKNLADRPEFREKKSELAAKLRGHLLEIRDTGFLWEPELERRSRAAGVTRYELARDPMLYDLPTILQAAWDAGSASSGGQSSLLTHSDSGVRFWTLQSHHLNGEFSVPDLLPLLEDGNPTVEIAAAGLLAQSEEPSAREKAEKVFLRYIDANEPRLRLYNARTLALAPKPDWQALEQPVREALKSLENPDRKARLKYRDFTYSAFTAWALEWSLVKAGLASFEELQARP